ncbi:hypothetical protein ONV78_04950 [Hahella sp. CR1]|uniref:hypothetical protein n=1 Tax=Hahella sp. CR1 TaxID=2992807 RepID=UPI0024431FA7|nr:hypothetical protein [Hahella sp. CR1]MDG9667076.1 hypothetical protein [Hahella sp. CR1]
MCSDLTVRGCRVTISRNDTPAPIVGWLLGESSLGVLIAMDESLSDIRLVEDAHAISYDYDNMHESLLVEDAKQVKDQLRVLNNDISENMREAISKVRFDRLHDINYRLAQLKEIIYREKDYFENRLYLEQYNELFGFLIAHVDQVADLHRETYNIYEYAGLTKILEEIGPKLVELRAELIIPAYDLEFESRRELITSFDNSWTREKHINLLDAVEKIRFELIRKAGQEFDSNSKSEPEEPCGGDILSRWVGPSLRILAGTGLTIANAAAGISAGLVSSVTTIGFTAIPAYIGVAGSIHTGLIQVADGCERIGRRGNS